MAQGLEAFTAAVSRTLGDIRLPDGQANGTDDVWYNGLFDVRPVKRAKTNDRRHSGPEDRVARIAAEYVSALKAGANMLEVFTLLIQKHMEAMNEKPVSTVKIAFILDLFEYLLSSPHLIPPNSKMSELAVMTTQLFEYIHPQLTIANPNLWLITFEFMMRAVRNDPKVIETIPSGLAVNIVKHILMQINGLPADLSDREFECVQLGTEFINVFLVGLKGNGAGCLSHYDVILALPDVYGKFQGGVFAQSVHWTIEKFVNELGKRRRQLSFLMMPPDASWRLISQISRRHEYNDLTTRTSFKMFEGDLVEFVQEGNATSFETHFRDMLYQRASMDEYRQLTRSATGTPIEPSQVRKAIVRKTRDVVRCIQERSRFDVARDDADQNRDISMEGTSPDPERTDVKILIPQHLEFWELLIETADQLYSFVCAEFFTYEDILRDFHRLVHHVPDTEDEFDQGLPLQKDNSLIWLLCQLFHVEKIGRDVAADLAGDERLFGLLVSLYNDKQITSVDAFSLRDLALQCAMAHQKAHLRDTVTIKERHPQSALALPYASICYQLQQEFNTNYYSNATNEQSFKDLPMQEIIKVAMESLQRQNLVPNTLYVYLVPNVVEIASLAMPNTTYLRGGSLDYKLLDMLNVCAKHRLVGLIHKMMLQETGPRVVPDKAPQANCVSPYVIDVAYKLLYSAPCASDLIVKELFDKLRRCDKLIKSHTESNTVIPDHTLRWLHTILQLLNYRCLRYLKLSPLAPVLLHYIRYSISCLEHRQIYQVLESFALNIMRMQIDVKLLRSLDDPNRDKPIWFAESELLARVMVISLARLIKMRGQADISTDLIHRVLSSFYPYHISWSPETLQYFPDSLKTYYETNMDADIPEKPTVNQQKINQLVQGNDAHNAFLLHGSTSSEKTLKDFYSKLENQPSFLCVLWTITMMKKSADAIAMASVRKIMLMFAPARLSTYTCDLIAYILEREYNSAELEHAFNILDQMIWKYQILSFGHVMFALIKGHHEARFIKQAFRFLDYLLFRSPHFKERAEKWRTLGVASRYWTENDHFDKLMVYLKEYPEYFDFDAFAMSGYDKVLKPLDPPSSVAMPIYFTNVITRSFPYLDLAIGRLIEYEELDLLIKFLDTYGWLYSYHHYPLSFLRTTIHYYYGSTTLLNPEVMKRLLKLLDFDQQELAPELRAYAHGEGGNPTDLFDRSYFKGVVFRLANNVSPHKCAPKASPHLPERHFREISSPAVLALYNACIEIMATPIPAKQVVNILLDLVFVRGEDAVAIPSYVIHAIGLLMPCLPNGYYVAPIWEEMIGIMQNDPYLLENSEKCSLLRCEISTPGISEQRGWNVPSESDIYFLEDTKATVFPYIVNDYTFNVNNFTLTTANCMLTLFHSILHYSSLDSFVTVLEYFKALREGVGLRTDVQLLYCCAMLGPILHRIEKIPRVDAEFPAELMKVVAQVTTAMNISSDTSYVALEEVYDFLFHIRNHFLKSPDTVANIHQIILSMKPSIAKRLIRLVI
ncbi:hypothetical protein BZG36_00320 [Bifiguratus adelaidae]|uniref:Mediator of RNA polymerase II transcription subunit 23 n=1 Tax=Bifiguratus adelaidae TaxID=1938954 RepID=A0A261Y821_9FUNG|nr:hypothetical protein BZG36_00320 [Bifiguratus adelaidae]